MKVYLSTVNKNTNSKWASNLPMLDGLVLDSEGTDIICDDFISSFEYNEIGGLLSKIASKIRLKGKLTIADVDANIIFRRGYNEEISENDANIALFANQKRKSLISLKTVIKMLPPNLEIESKTYDHQTCRFILVLRRVS
jgi:hypothetical protein